MEALGEIAHRLVEKLEAKAKVQKVPGYLERPGRILMAQTRCALRGAGRKSPLDRLPCPASNDNLRNRISVLEFTGH